MTDKINIKLLEEKLREVKIDEIGLIGGGLQVTPLMQEANLFAQITPKTWDVEIKLNPEWRPEKDKTLTDYLGTEYFGTNKDDREKGIFEICSDILRHEGRHWKDEDGCPTDMPNHDVILDAVHRALRDSGKVKTLKAREGDLVDGMTAYVANSFQDIVINSANRNFLPQGYKGVPAFFYEQGKKPGFNAFYEAFVKLNMHIWGNDDDKKLVEKFYASAVEKMNPMSKKKNVDAVVQGVAADLGLNGKLEDIVKKIANKRSWSRMAYAFAKRIAELLEEGGQMALSPSDSDENGESKSAKGQGEKEQQMKDAEEKRKIIIARIGKKGGPSKPSYMQSFPYLDALYDALASRVTVNVESRTRNFQLPIVDYAYEEYDPTMHEADEIDFRRIIISKDSPFASKLGKPLNFQVAREHYSLPIPTKIGQRGYPDICAIMDTSGSEQAGGGNILNPEADQRKQWTDGCNYHFGMLGFYGVLKYLQAEGIAPYLMWNMINFGDTTAASGWKNYGSISDLKKHALSPQFGGTVLNPNVLARELDREPCLVFLLSDGEIYNWGNDKNKIKQVLTKHYTSFIQLGHWSGAAEDMKSWGIAVYPVTGKKDLDELMVDLTRKKVREIYGR